MNIFSLLFAIASLLSSGKPLSVPSAHPLIVPPGPPLIVSSDPSLPVDNPELQYDDVNYEGHIRTVQFYRGNREMTYPVLYLGDETPLTLEFDELIHYDGDVSDLWVTFVSCDAYWEPSTLMSMEYLDGFTYDRITDWSRSANTRIPYIHYRYSFPGQYVKFKRSGNYLLYVYRNGDEKQLVLSRRFMIADNKVGIRSNTGMSFAPTDRVRLQSVSFDVFPNAVDLTDPFQDLVVMVLQNGRWDNAARNMKPQFIYPDHLEYRFNAASEFEGGNEYRLLDIRSTRFHTQAMAAVQDRDSLFYILLYADEPRLENRYSAQFDFNGNYFIEVQEYPNYDTEADYVLVDFRLRTPIPVDDGSVYVFGRFTDWKPREECQMMFNPLKNRYETNFLMKQGVYNFQYVVKNRKTGKVDEKKLEGSHFETENAYTILIYYKSITDRSHELVGIDHLNYYDPR